MKDSRLRRAELLEVTDNRRTDRVLFAPLADGIFAAWLAGKKWVSDTTLDDQIAAAERCGYHAGFVRGSTPDLSVNPALNVRTELVEQSDERRIYTQSIETPHGTLTARSEDRPGEGMTRVQNWLSDVSELDAADWISRQVADGAEDDRIRQTYSEFSEKVSPHGVSQVQLELPYYLYGLGGFAEGPLMLALTESDRYARSMELAEQALMHTAGLLLEAGVDFLWIGASGTELLSPDIWERFVVPQARRMVEHVRSLGGRTHFHCCGRSQLWVEKGYYDQIGMDLVETLSPPPSGTVEDLSAARKSISPEIVTKGNIDLGLIRDGTADQCAAAAREVIEATAGFPHIVAAADALLWGTPVENVVAIRETCEQADRERQA
ncbi:MAG: uroporphyrinogen decarboxylase family protein [Phycisphaerae bacterium]